MLPAISDDRTIPKVCKISEGLTTIKILQNHKRNMTNREEIIQNYIDGYNQFDIDKMFADFDDNVLFENIQNGKINMSLSGLTALRQQADQVKSYFSARKQTIKSFKHSDSETEIEIDYNAVLAIDFPNGLKSGQELNLTGKSIFKFSEDKIIKLTDIS